jgi:hypothetical protein
MSVNQSVTYVGEPDPSSHMREHVVGMILKLSRETATVYFRKRTCRRIHGSTITFILPQAYAWGYLLSSHSRLESIMKSQTIIFNQLLRLIGYKGKRLFWTNRSNVVSLQYFLARVKVSTGHPARRCDTLRHRSGS